ncbi:MAG TPA: serine/threonine-protein kinase, partial [Polyangia bacterium]
MATQSPSRYGKYEVVGRLATGGMADLFLARQRGPSGFELLAVVKRIRPHLAANPEFVRMFLDEARLAAQLRHPNVVSVYDAGQERGEYFFVMEYVHGRDVRRIMDAAKVCGRQLTLDETMSIAVGVCAGLHHAHERTDGNGAPLGIVHRDISPSNVLVGFEGGVKLADFGIAKATQAATKEPGTNTLRGKLMYLSPEQVLGLSLDRRADLYALSVVLYELTTGTRPHDDAPTEFVAMKRTLEDPVPLPSTRLRGYPEELERIVMRGLAVDRDMRWWSAREMQVELETFARQRQLAMSPVTLARLMEELFPDELHAWHAAQSRGTPLVEHVTKSHTLSIDEVGDATTEPRVEPAAPPARKRRGWIAAALALTA